MNWKRPLLPLAAFCVSLFATTAVHAATNTVPDAEVPRYLTPQQVTQWNDAQKKFAQASADLIKGQKLATETADEGTLVKPDLTADHAKGNAMVKDANTAKNEANRTLNTLRRAAADNRNKSRSASQLTADTTFEVATGQWPEAVITLSKNVFTTLNDQKYKHVYLAGIYSLEKDGKYAAKPDLAAQVRQQLSAADKNKTLAPKGEGLFKLGQENGKLFLSYPERAADQAGNAKSAVVVGEILFESRSGYAAVSLRAVDLSTMRVVASNVMMLSVESTFGKMLGLRLTDVASKRIAPATSDKTSKDKDDETPPPVSVNLQDPDDYLSKAKQLKTSLGLASVSHPDALPNRFAILMLKSYFLSEQKDLKTSDIDFLTLALPDEKPDVTATVPADLSGVWILPNVDSLSASIVLDPLKARDLATGTETTVGKLTITRNLPKLDLPKTEELKAAGY
jgi:hypothetical protein